MCDQIVNLVEQVKGGSIRAYAIATAERSPALPDVPTTKEAGLPEYQVSAWNALFAERDAEGRGRQAERHAGRRARRCCNAQAPARPRQRDPRQGGALSGALQKLVESGSAGTRSSRVRAVARNGSGPKVGLFIPVLRRRLLSRDRRRDARAARALGVKVSLSARPDLLRPADGEQRLPRGRGAGRALRQNFAKFDYVVTPSGSCTHHVREKAAAPQHLELTEFLHDVLKVREFRGRSSRTRSGCTSGAGLRGPGRQHQRDRRAGVLKPLALLSSGKGADRQARASRRVLRLRRDVLGDRGAGVGAHGLRQGERPTSPPAPSTSSRRTPRA